MDDAEFDLLRYLDDNFRSETTIIVAGQEARIVRLSKTIGSTDALTLTAEIRPLRGIL